ncbi:MAG: hypothetical protein KDC46_14030 [Thermoleophilia bacterium]|nr:hypothetical protein [Thermoleophilia bacterium]
MAVHTIQLSDDELRILQSAMRSWVNTFTHDQPDLLHRSKLLAERIDAEAAMPVAAPTAGVTPM